MRVCPDCHASVDDRAKFCDNCGYLFQHEAPSSSAAPSQGMPSPAAGDLGAGSPPAPSISPGTCSTCGYVNIPGEMFCQNCGVQLAPVASVPPPLPVKSAVAGQPSYGEQVAGPPFAPPQLVAELEKPVASGSICPVCGFANDPKDVFCQNCGSQLAGAGSAPPAPAESPALEQPEEKETLPSLSARAASLGHAPPAARAPGIGKFVVRDTRAVVLLPQDRQELVLGRTDPVRNIFPDVDLTPYGGEKGGVSRIHARLILQGGQVYIEDLNSTNFTFLNKQKIYPGQRYPLKHGDELRVGLLVLEYWAE